MFWDVCMTRLSSDTPNKCFGYLYGCLHRLISNFVIQLYFKDKFLGCLYDRLSSTIPIKV